MWHVAAYMHIYTITLCISVVLYIKKTVRLLAFDHILILHCYYICIFMAIVKLGLKKKKSKTRLPKQAEIFLQTQTQTILNTEKY